jgi:SAM-dependent methyltransferase
MATRTTAVGAPTPFAQLRWWPLRLLLGSVGRLARGIRIGHRHGFDSGTMLDYVYLNQPHGWLGIGRLIDRVYLSAIGWRAIRARRALLTDVLRERIEANRHDGRPTRILDVAAGPGRYLQDLLLGDQNPDDVRILCRDLAPDGLRRGADLAVARDLVGLIRYEVGDAFDPAPTEQALGGRPDVIVVSGLYELVLDDDLVRRSIGRLRDLLAPGGTLVFTTQVEHPQLAMIAGVLTNRDGEPWVMRCRSVDDVEARARAAGFDAISSRAEPVGLFTVTTASVTTASVSTEPKG